MASFHIDFTYTGFKLDSSTDILYFALYTEILDFLVEAKGFKHFMVFTLYV